MAEDLSDCELKTKFVSARAPKPTSYVLWESTCYAQSDISSQVALLAGDKRTPRTFSACRWAAFTGTTIFMTPSLWGRLEASKADDGIIP